MTEEARFFLANRCAGGLKGWPSADGGRCRITAREGMADAANSLARIIPASQILSSGKSDGVRTFVDAAVATEDGKLVLLGWIYDPRDEVRGLAVLSAGREGDGTSAREKPGRGNWLASAVQRGRQAMTNTYIARPFEESPSGARIVRVARPDVSTAMKQPSGGDDMHGFIIVAPAIDPDEALAVALADDRHVRLAFKRIASPPEIASKLRHFNALPGMPLLATLKASLGERHALCLLLEESGRRQPGRSWPKAVSSRREAAVALAGDLQSLPTYLEDPDLLLASVDRGVPLGEAGIIFFGWSHAPARRPRSISVCDSSGNRVNVERAFVSLLRPDVTSFHQDRFPAIGDRCGFACLAAIPTKASEPRALCFDFGDAGEVNLRIPSDSPDVSGIALACDLLGHVVEPYSQRLHMFEIFDKALGMAVEAVAAARAPPRHDIDSAQFGAAPPSPDISVIVPLYGRFDFLRHQLAHFAADNDMRRADLIYVVDDPAIATATLDLAARYHEVFGVPFRVLSYGENRGYAGANNIGARHARGRRAVFLNSDVIPRQPGWLSVLAAALDGLPGAAAVGPLLQFADGAIQHAGMYPRKDPGWPGFLLNSHRRMGLPWTAGDEPSEHPMLTAACLMVRTADFHDVGGFDESYLVGDFEDSDLCLAIRRRGGRMYLVPAARLWHLERQSQGLAGQPADRQLLTLFNAWRYTRKIRDGKLVDPSSLDLSP
jgi:GT2 family glycosyltransferase